MNFIIKGKVYPYDIMVSLGESDKKLFKTLRKVKISEEEIKLASLEKSHGRYIMFSGNQSLIRLPKIPKSSYWLGVLVHEINHCTFQILRSAGVKFSSKSEEAYTYLSQYITYKILKKCQIF